MKKLSFRARIALLSTVLSGLVIVVFGVWAWQVVRWTNLRRIDEDIRELGHRHLHRQQAPHHWGHVGESLQFVYGGEETRISQYKLDTLLNKPFLFQADTAGPLQQFSLKRYYLTKSWIHFKTKAGAVVRTRRVIGETLNYGKAFQNFKFTAKLKFDGKAVLDAVETVSFISKDEELADKKTEITLSKNKMVFRTEIEGSWAEKSIKVDYTKNEKRFKVNSEQLKEVLKKVSYLYIGKSAVLLKSGNFKHLIALYN